MTLVGPVLAHGAVDLGTIWANGPAGGTGSGGTGSGSAPVASAPYRAPSQAPLKAIQPTSVITQQYIDNNVPPTRNYDTVINIAPVSASPDELALLEGRMHQAVQRAVVYPMAASEMHLLGRVQVAFTLHDGRVEDVGMVRGSGFPILDRAALAAVRSASYPNTPTVQQDRSPRFLVWVAFRPTGDD